MPREVAAIDVNGPAIPSSGTVSAGPAALRTAEDMARDSGLTASSSVVDGAIINAPTIPLSEYKSLKAWSAEPVGSKGPGSSGPSGAYVPVTKGVNFAGSVQGENGKSFVPPDTHMAAGLAELVETTNSSIDVFSKVSSGTPALLRTTSQNAFTGSVDTLGDSRVIYDQTANRWIITIDDFSGLTNGAKPSYYLAVSKTPYAAVKTGVVGSGSFFVYPVFISTNPSGLFYDYPQLGMDQDAILLTANMFTPSSFFANMVHSIAKQRIYNGLGFSFSIFFASAASGTLAPPILQNFDQNPNDYFLAAPVGSGKTALHKYTMSSSSRRPNNFTGPISITVASYTTPPPPATQPSPCNVAADRLDTLDGRFQNASFQVGNNVWNVHTRSVGGFAKPKFYQVNAGTNALVQSAQFFKSSTSFDFNPSISGVNSSVIVNWSATDPDHGLKLMVMFGGRVSTTALNTISVRATPAFTSPACLTGSFDSRFGMQRWGDYSTVSLDWQFAGGNGIFWILNEDAPSASWGSRGVRVGN
ncbi:MAG: hypothetical protein Q7S58_18980 [Candidatus Binatus sp.]|uniref:hypothetical protein n=1 Tax=Candidatus Binatus sp. TaxID=2811406 RepID=UPI002719F0C8|nr:hypothetical protein [Candidatus Binatus sp.]MDO8434485.1 hypothetical protein [Candidatus Binatus sp.]